MTDVVRDDAFAVLSRIRSKETVAPARPGEQCDLCGVPIAEEHSHVVDVQQRGLRCVCRPCYLVFAPQGAGGGHFRAVPDRYRMLSDLQMSTAQWDGLQIPVSVAFFFVNSALGRVAAFYPSPVGATESLLALDVWDELVAADEQLATMEPDVEALLVRADKERGAPECFLVPIDACYELVGQLRKLWKGFDGGSEARAALEQFFVDVRERAT